CDQDPRPRTEPSFASQTLWCSQSSCATSAEPQLSVDARAPMVRLEQPLEAFEVFVKHLGRRQADHRRHAGADLAGRRVILKKHFNIGGIGAELSELHVAGADNVRRPNGFPSEQAWTLFIDDVRVPLELDAAGALDHPVRLAVAAQIDPIHIRHEARQVWQVAPEIEHVLRWAVDANTFRNPDATRTAEMFFRQCICHEPAPVKLANMTMKSKTRTTNAASARDL